MKTKKDTLDKIQKIALWTGLISMGIGLFIIAMYFGFAILDSHNICNAMNLTGCLK